MKSKTGSFLTALGSLLVFAALALFLYNQRQSDMAEKASMEVMPELVEAIHVHVQEAAAETLPVAAEEASVREMPESRINGESYIGFIGIPALDLELPVMSDWSYKKLNIAPCRYSGSLYSDDLVLMAHNYRNHFGRLSSLSLGDVVTFTDMDGKTAYFEVTAMDLLGPAAVEEMTAGGSDLTLFTCTYGGTSRVTVRCDRVNGSP